MIAKTVSAVILSLFVLSVGASIHHRSHVVHPAPQVGYGIDMWDAQGVQLQIVRVWHP